MSIPKVKLNNGTLQFDLPGYANADMTCGGMNIASNDVIKLVTS